MRQHFISRFVVENCVLEVLDCLFHLMTDSRDSFLEYYLQDVFGQSTESAAAIASIFGWMNLFARGLGGVCSDALNESLGMRGRIIAQTFLLLFEGIAVVVFARTDTLAGAVIVLVLFSLLVQAAEGASYGIVPYVDPINMGSVTGIVGAGGNLGAVCFGLAFRNLEYEKAFVIMGCTIIASSFLSVFIHIKGHSGLLSGEDRIVDKETGEIIEFDNDAVYSRKRSEESLI
jgi:NNP family nitrate/nitrite transporter-like MFS transporter